MQPACINTEGKEIVFIISERIHRKGKVPAVKVSVQGKLRGRQFFSNKIVTYLRAEIPFWSQFQRNIARVDGS